MTVKIAGKLPKHDRNGITFESLRGFLSDPGRPLPSPDGPVVVEEVPA